MSFKAMLVPLPWVEALQHQSQIAELRCRLEGYSDVQREDREAVQLRNRLHALKIVADELRDSLRQVLALSDRKHDAWDRARAALDAYAKLALPASA